MGICGCLNGFKVRFERFICSMGLAGYLTTSPTPNPNDTTTPRRCPVSSSNQIPANKPMKYVYIMAAWENAKQTHPAIQTFTSKSMAIAVAKNYRDEMHFEEVLIRRDLMNSPIGWNSVGKFVEF